MLSSKRFLWASMITIALIVLSGCSSLQLEEIVIVLPDMPAGCAQQTLFRAVGYDKNKIIVSLREDLVWTCSPDSGVSIDADPAGQSAQITFTDPGTYTVSAAKGQISEDVVVEVVCRQLARVVVQPAFLDLKQGEAQWLTVIGYDQYDDPIAITGDITWSVTGGVGTVDPVIGSGTTFTSTDVGQGTVRADTGGLFDSSPVEVIPASVLTTILISPQFGTALVGKCTFLTGTPYDQYGDEMQLSCSPTWSVGGGIGTVSPSRGWSTTFCATTMGLGSVSITCNSVTETLEINVLDCG